MAMTVNNPTDNMVRLSIMHKLQNGRMSFMAQHRMQRFAANVVYNARIRLWVSQVEWFKAGLLEC
jgi:hypothetical protein